MLKSFSDFLVVHVQQKGMGRFKEQPCGGQWCIWSNGHRTWVMKDFVFLFEETTPMLAQNDEKHVWKVTDILTAQLSCSVYHV